MSPAGRRAWRSPLTLQTYRDVPDALADRLDELAAAAMPSAAAPHSIERSQARQELRCQVDELLRAFSHRDAYLRIRDELHAGDDGLLPISEDRRVELADRAATFASLRDHHVANAVEDGASLHDAALAGGITLQEARAIVHQRTTDAHDT